MLVIPSSPPCLVSMRTERLPGSTMQPFRGLGDLSLKRSETLGLSDRPAWLPDAAFSSRRRACRMKGCDRFCVRTVVTRRPSASATRAARAHDIARSLLFNNVKDATLGPNNPRTYTRTRLTGLPPRHHTIRVACILDATRSYVGPLAARRRSTIAIVVRQAPAPSKFALCEPQA